MLGMYTGLLDPCSVALFCRRRQHGNFDVRMIGVGRCRRWNCGAFVLSRINVIRCIQGLFEALGA